LRYKKPARTVGTARAKTSVNLFTNFSGKHGDRNANSRVPQIKHVVPAVDEVDVNVVGISPSHGPGLSNLKPVAAVLKARPAFEDFDVTDREVMFVAEVSAKMVIFNAAGMLFVTFLVVPLFLLNVFVFVAMIVVMIVLGKDRDHPCE
jgi:hypothetical protein